ncbi:MAG: phosphoglucosamine mutase [Phycisphaerae bacterium]
MALMIGVSGVRGLVGKTFTPELVLQFAHAYGTVLEGGPVVLARDSRPSGEMFALAGAAGLAAAGCHVSDLGVAMTPTAAFAIRAGAQRGGIVITASHNPSPWNGLKFLDDQGLGPDPETVKRISTVREQRGYRSVEAGFEALRRDSDAGERHAAAVRAAVDVDLRALRGVRVVLDSVNGAGGIVTPAFLQALGCDVVPINTEPSGVFAHAPEPVAENLAQLCGQVRAAKAAIGFAQDPDADRLALVDEHGRFVGEEYTLALGAWSVLAQRKGAVAANLSTSRMVDDLAQRFGTRVYRTPVGESHVARAIRRHDCVVGGEGNGGVIDPRISPVRDSLSAMSLVLQLMASTGKRVSELVAELPRYVMIKQKFECPAPRIAQAVDAIATAFAGERLDRADGVRIDLSDGWVHVRPSNTEPIVRFIAEARDADAAERIIARARAAAGL